MTDDSPDLVASTGVNDQSSPWTGLLQSALQTGISVGGNALQSVLAQQTPEAQTPGTPTRTATAAAPGGSAPAAAGNSKTWLWLMAGAVVALIAWLVLVRE